MLLHNHNFVHGLDFYGSFLAIKQNFSLDIIDDIDYLTNNSYFQKNLNHLFFINENYLSLFEKEENVKKNKIIIHNESLKSQISVNSISELSFTKQSITEPIIDTPDLNELELVVDSPLTSISKHSVPQFSFKSNSSCSSRSSYTTNFSDTTTSIDTLEETGDESSSSVYSEEYTDMSIENESIYIRIPKFPVQIICMEKCENTMDAWITV
jgi:hypothetical protein